MTAPQAPLIHSYILRCLTCGCEAEAGQAALVPASADFHAAHSDHNITIEEVEA